MSSSYIDDNSNHSSESTSSSSSPVDLMPLRKADPVAPLRRFWNWDFCVAHHHETTTTTPSSPPPRMRSATMESHASQNNHDEVDGGLEQMLHKAQVALDNFWQKNKATSTTTTNTTTMENTPKVTDREIITPSSKEIADEPKEEEQVKVSVIVTEPGTSRALRVYRGLELFLLTLVVLGLTFQLLHRSGIHFSFAIQAKE